MSASGSCRPDREGRIFLEARGSQGLADRFGGLACALRTIADLTFRKGRRRSMVEGISRRGINRRGFLTVGTIRFGLTLGDFFRLKARAELKNYAAIAAKADSVIHIYLPGGMAHQESFDPKPLAPIEYRGEMKPIPTKVDGEVFCETLPNIAQIADKITVIR